MKFEIDSIKRILLSRTDSIGDVILTLPVAGLLKKTLPQTEIIFLGSGYTRNVVEACEHIDGFIDWNEIRKTDSKEQVQRFKEISADCIVHVFPVKEIARIAKKAGIPIRLGTTNRIYHWTSCNEMERLSRKKSELHEAQLNLKLVRSLTGISRVENIEIPSLYGLTKLERLDTAFSTLPAKDKYNLILHPKSKGSAREWGIENFKKLAQILPEEKFKIFITGTEAEGKMIRDEGFFDSGIDVTDLTGKQDLNQLLAFINNCDGLVAASTGPLHIAAALGKFAIGLYPPIKPMHPGRWAPLGENASYLVKDVTCNDCRTSGKCHCMMAITPEQLVERIVSTMDQPGS